MTISLLEMKSVRLMERIDTKFICSREKLEELLSAASGKYLVQETEGERIQTYRTRYLDTAEEEMYQEHQRGKKDRYKIRFRTYEQSGLSFLEVKHKDNHGRTTKIRKPWKGEEELETAGDFLNGNSPYPPENLFPSLTNRFNRITLVNPEKTERLTIDLDLESINPRTGRKVCFPELVIIELKRDGRKASIMQELLRELRIKPAKFSKYCIGMALTDPDLKQNLFKERIRAVRRCTEIIES